LDRSVHFLESVGHIWNHCIPIWDCSGAIGNCSGPSLDLADQVLDLVGAVWNDSDEVLHVSVQV